LVAHNRGGIIGENSRQGLEVSGFIARRVGQFQDRLLAFGDRIEVMPTSA
jgi:hypothetical protein